MRKKDRENDNKFNIEKNNYYNNNRKDFDSHDIQENHSNLIPQDPPNESNTEHESNDEHIDQNTNIKDNDQSNTDNRTKDDHTPDNDDKSSTSSKESHEDSTPTGSIAEPTSNNHKNKQENDHKYNIRIQNGGGGLQYDRVYGSDYQFAIALAQTSPEPFSRPAWMTRSSLSYRVTT